MFDNTSEVWILPFYFYADCVNSGSFGGLNNASKAKGKLLGERSYKQCQLRFKSWVTDEPGRCEKWGCFSIRLKEVMQ